MEAKDLRELGLTELNARVGQWKEELFRGKLRKFSGEVKDTTAARKQRRDIARALTVVREKTLSALKPEASNV